MAFFECEFPRKIGFSSSGGGTTPAGGPGWSTIVNMGFSGFEQRNRNWATVRNKYQLDLVGQPFATYQIALNFFLAVGGKADAFRFFDPLDFQATGISTSPAAGDGNNKIFQLQNQYTVGAGPSQRTYTRTISKPIQAALLTGGSALTDFLGNSFPNTVNVYVAGVKKTLGTDYTVDATTGLVSFISAPGLNLAITADCQYHIPVRFDNDDWPAQILESQVASTPGSQSQSGNILTQVVGVQLVEVRITPGQSQG